jgi:hypothetical protein
MCLQEELNEAKKEIAVLTLQLRNRESQYDVEREISRNK